MNALRLSWKNLINKPLSMTLSLVLFALGVGMISLLLLLNKQLEDKFDKNLAGIDLVVGAKGSPLQLILCSMYQVDTPTGNISLKEARPFLNPKHPLIEQAVPLSLGDSHQGYRIVGTTREFLGLYDAEISEGKLWQEDFEVTIGTVVAEKLGIKVGDKFHSSHGFVIDENLIHDDGQAFKVVGIFKPTGAVVDQLILATPQSIWKVHDHDHGAEAHTPSDSTHQHEPATPDHTSIQALLDEDETKEITSLLVTFKARNFRTLNMPRNINENTDMQAAVPAIEMNRLYANMGVGMDFLQILALVIILVSGLSIFISLFSSLRERKYELSLMRVMGASRGKLFFLIILEGLLLASVGYALGMLLSHGGMEILANYMEDSYRYSFTGKQFLTSEIYLLAGALGVGFIAAILPAIQASRTDISETLARG